MRRVAAIDCGTNSIRLLIAEPDGSGGLKDLERRLEIVRLGQGVDASGEFDPDAVERTFAAVDQYAELIKKADIGVEKVHFVATSAARDVKNRDGFFAGIKERLGVLPDVISGETEARLSFNGALSRVTPAGEPVLVMDIGGGSTELITGSAAGKMHCAISIDVGSVRVTERFLKQNPVAEDDLARAAEYVDNLLAGSGVDFASIGTWIGVGGTATTLAGVYLELEQYDRERVHGAIPSANRRAAIDCRSWSSPSPVREETASAGSPRRPRSALVATMSRRGSSSMRMPGVRASSHSSTRSAEAR